MRASNMCVLVGAVKLVAVRVYASRFRCQIKAVAEVATVIEMSDIRMFCRLIHHKYVDLLFFSIRANLQTVMGKNFRRKRSKKLILFLTFLVK